MMERESPGDDIGDKYVTEIGIDIPSTCFISWVILRWVALGRRK
jgi:hypothetical protein